MLTRVTPRGVWALEGRLEMSLFVVNSFYFTKRQALPSIHTRLYGGACFNACHEVMASQVDENGQPLLLIAQDLKHDQSTHSSFIDSIISILWNLQRSKARNKNKGFPIDCVCGASDGRTADHDAKPTLPLLHAEQSGTTNNMFVRGMLAAARKIHLCIYMAQIELIKIAKICASWAYIEVSMIAKMCALGSSTLRIWGALAGTCSERILNPRRAAIYARRSSSQ